MAREVIGRIVLAVWLGCVTAAAQLPPEIQVDRYLLRADRLMEAKDPQGALELMGKIVALQKEHGLTFPTASGSCAWRTAVSRKARLWRRRSTASGSCATQTGPSRM